MSSIEQKIGFTTVREWVSELCMSALGKQKCADMQFCKDFEMVSRQLHAVAEMLAIFSSDEDFPLNNVHDLTDALRGIRVVGTHISEQELPRLYSSMMTIAAISSFFARHRNDDARSPFPTLDLLAQRIGTFPQIRAMLERIIDPLGNIKDSASPELARIRSALASMSGTINSLMRRVISNAVRDGIIDNDTTPSVRDGRLVIPVAPMNKRRLQGIVHDESASGKTIYIEPAEVVEANNRQRELQIEERREILRILVELADNLRPHLPELLEAYDVLGEFDFINAKARFAQTCGATMPHLHPEPQLEWYHACHPVLQASLQKQGKEIVPLDIRLTPEQRILLISGPNAGGKSVTLKTLAIVQYMTQCGLLPPVYENSHIGMMDGILLDIGDDQSIEDDLSTYSSHLLSMKRFLRQGDSSTLILIDEFGSGTEPQIGGAIAQAILAKFVEKKVWGVITTHFQNLKHFADETPGLVNGSMLYDRQKMQPLFRLSIGSPGSSFALEIARNIGLPADIIKNAEEIVGSDYINIDKYLLDIARDKRYWENKRLAIKQKEKKIDDALEKYESDAQILREKRREIIEDAKEEAKRILDQSNAAIERTIHEIKLSQANKEATQEARRQLNETKSRLQNDTADGQHPLLKQHKNKRKKSEAKPQQPKAETLNVGDNVQLDGSGTVGKILQINGKDAIVAFGQLKTTVKVDRLRRTMRQVETGARKAASFVTTATRDNMRERQLNFNREIDVRGMRVDEAVQAVTYFIDDATQFGADRVRILHGTGTGALRQYIRDYLHTVSSVADCRDEDVRFGGAGITVVTLK